MGEEQRAGWSPPRLGSREQRALGWLASVEPPRGIVLPPSLWESTARASGLSVRQVKRLARRAASGGDSRVAWYAEHRARLQRRTRRGPGPQRRLITKAGAVKDMVRSALEANGHYVMLCGHRYTRKSAQEREMAIREAVRGAGMTIRDDQVRFWDADQIAAWANRHPAVAIWLKEHTQAGAVGVFHSWVHWAGRAEHEDSP